MKNKLLLISAVGFMTVISSSVFSQTVAPVNSASATTQPIPNKIIQPTQSGKNQAIKPSPSVQSVHAVSTANQPVPNKIIQPTSGGKNQAVKPAIQPAHAALTAPPPNHPMHVPAQPVSDAKSTATVTTNSSPAKQ